MKPAEYVSKVSNNNRRAEREREKKQPKEAQRRKHRSGLLEPAESAGAEEKFAYDAIKAEDHAQIAWVIKQPAGKESDFYQKITSPYYTASDMLTKARAVVNPSTWHNATVFLQTWRDRGTPVPKHTSAVTSTAISTQVTVAPPRGSDRAFQHAWHVSRVCELRVKVVAIEYRWAMAFLGRAYAKKASQLGIDKTGFGHAKTQAIDTLHRLVDPAGTPEGRRTFWRRLNMCQSLVSARRNPRLGQPLPDARKCYEHMGEELRDRRVATLAAADPACESRRLCCEQSPRCMDREGRVEWRCHPRPVEALYRAEWRRSRDRGE